MQDIGAAVLDKVRQEARAIVRAAEEEAERERERARRQREARTEAERRRMLGAADMEAARIVAQAVMEARNTLAAAKARIMEEIVTRARQELDSLEPDRARLEVLIREAVDGLGKAGHVILGVRAAELETAREIVATDQHLASLVGSIEARPLGGGVQAESADGAIAVDNSYEARLGMLVPRVLARLASELFQA